MPENQLTKFLPLIFFALLLLISFFFNYISTLYSEADLFKLDLTKGRKTTKIKKLLFILKRGQILSATVSFYQVMLNFFMSLLATKVVKENKELLNKFWKAKHFIFLLISLFIALFTEILVRFLATKNFSKRIVFNKFLINTGYALTRLSFFQLVIKPKKKVFINSERDVSRFVGNLAAEEILEEKEAKLIRAALNFDELKASQALIKWEKVICLEKSMSYEEVEKIYSTFLFERYPVINKKKQLIGIFSMKIFSHKLLKNKKNTWQKYIEEKFVTIRPKEKLNKVFEKLQNSYNNLAIVKSNKKILGIITLQDILNNLVGEMKDEKDKLKQLSA